MNKIEYFKINFKGTGIFYLIIVIALSSIVISFIHQNSEIERLRLQNIKQTQNINKLKSKISALKDDVSTLESWNSFLRDEVNNLGLRLNVEV